MQNILDGLKKFRVARNIDDKDFIADIEASNLLEECSEYLSADSNYLRIDALCDIDVFSINAINYVASNLTTDNFLHNRVHNGEIASVIHRIGIFVSDNDLDTVYINLIEIHHIARIMMNDLGYDYEKCMLETIKEISSRMQDPTQMEDWAKNGVNGKWQKDKNQLPSTLYKADYDSCKLGDK